MSRVLRLALVATAALAVPAIAAAQTPAAQKPAGQGRGKEFVLGGLWLGPVGMGSRSAELLRSNGTTLTFFETENSLGSGLGLAGGVGFELTRAVWIEVLGGYGQAKLRTEVTGDFEDADIEPIRANVARFTVEGAALFYFGAGGSSAWFARGGGGWGRELHEGEALAEDTFHGTGSIGWRHWWGQPRGRARSGFRVSGGVELRTGGLTLSESSVRIGPTAAFHVFFGF